MKRTTFEFDYFRIPLSLSMLNQIEKALDLCEKNSLIDKLNHVSANLKFKDETEKALAEKFFKLGYLSSFAHTRKELEK